MRKVILFSFLLVLLASCGERKRSTPPPTVHDDMIVHEINNLPRPVIVFGKDVPSPFSERQVSTIILIDGNKVLHTYHNSPSVNVLVNSFEKNDTICK